MTRWLGVRFLPGWVKLSFSSRASNLARASSGRLPMITA